MRVLPVKAKIVGHQSLIDAINERRASRLAYRRAASHASKLNTNDYGSIKQLRQLLGLPPPHTSHKVESTPVLPEDALIVSFDTEWERRGLREHVVEIGVTTLDTRDIINTAPGPSANDWFSKAKTYHYVVDVTRRPTDRMRACYFSDDMFADIATIKRDLLSILQRAAHPPYHADRATGRGQRKVVLAGHSVSIDLHQLYRSPGLELDFFSKDVFLTKPTMAFDTLMLTDAAIQSGAGMKSAKLGKLVNWLGVHPQYRHNDTIIGCHNAGNDAAYTMMALLMFAVRWEHVVPGNIVPPSPDDQASILKHQDRASQDNMTMVLGKRAMRKARSLSKAFLASGMNRHSATSNASWRSWSRSLLGWHRRP